MPSNLSTSVSFTRPCARLERYGTLKGITRVASELLAEAISQKTIGPLSQETTSPLSQKTIGPAVERREPRVELPGKPEPPPAAEAEQQAVEPQKEQKSVSPEGEAAEAPKERSAESQKGQAGGAARGPTPKQLALIESLLKQLGDGWETVREVLLLDKGIEAPEDYRQLSGETLDRVIKALKDWARRPTARELRDARVRAQRLFEQGIDAGLPESTRDVLRYHLVKLELAEAGALKPRK
jgi:isopentenyl diphosphate isomerase/L-lactate dehydrogenase-like FMN-dependent dehydrogenase